MGLSVSSISLQLEFWKNGLYKGMTHVADMGSQQLHIQYELFKDLLATYSITHFNEEIFKNLKYFQENLLVLPKKFFQLLGFKNYDCIDLGGSHNAIPIDLNKPLEDKTLYNKFDLVTDYGNNEHPFNVAESYRTMHRLCKQGGLLIIEQALFGGNGYYNFDVGFFEGIASANNYDILASYYMIPIKKEQTIIDVNLPLVPDLIELFDWSKINYIGISYAFRKKSEADFRMPYQGDLQTSHYQEIYKSPGLLNKLPPERTYVPLATTYPLSQLRFHELQKEFIKRIKRKAKELIF